MTNGLKHLRKSPLLEGSEVAEAPDSATAPAEVVAEWATSLDLEPAEVQGAFNRAQQIAQELGPSPDLDASFYGLSDELQRGWWKVLARPERRLEIIDDLSDAAFEELLWYWDEALGDAERRPIERALGIVT